ncbi:MAG: carbohydrate kinase [Fusobacteria bacterium]|nr:MAG: carbohydrate kinase [Fusobacteriota bacterium]KAF0228472.1 MAG: carbohydrate [Fusobacteriota bacterium]
MLGLSNLGSREIDRKMIEDIGLPGVVLMEEAALGIYYAMSNRYNLEGKSIYIFVGKGNNGGDGLALARILFNRGFLVKIVTLFDEGYSNEAKLHLSVAKKMGIDIEPWNSLLAKPDIVVDAIFGTGIKGDLRGIVKEAVDWIGMSGAKVVAIDMPTGLIVDMTIALGYLKFEHLLSNDLKNIYLVKLEFTSNLENDIKEADKLHYLNAVEAGKILPSRDLEGHKGTYGKVGILGGRKEMLGAGLLAGKSALRSGCGLVTLWLESFEGILGLEPELMLEGWSLFLNKDIDILVIGPGLGREKNLDLEETLRSFKGKVLIDADGLYWLKMGWIKREWIEGEVVLTPHPKEMEMILGERLERRESVLKAANIYNCVAIIKGFRTLISDGKSVWVNLTGNPGMATAGSGDVLSGIIGGLLAQGIGTYKAVILGTYLHGLSGDLGVRVLGQESLIASDLIEYLPKALSRVKTVVDNMKIVEKIY